MAVSLAQLSFPLTQFFDCGRMMMTSCVNFIFGLQISFVCVTHSLLCYVSI